MSGSLASLSRALTTAFSSRTATPEELQEIVTLYIDKHTPPSESDRSRLQEELLTIYNTHVSGTPNIPTFLHVLTVLKHEFILDPDYCQQWWKLLLSPILNQSEHLKATLRDSLEICMDILVFSQEDPHFKTRYAAAEAMKAHILEAYFEASVKERRSVSENIEHLLLTFAKKRTQEFFETMDPYFQDPAYRLLSLTLLSTFVRFQTQYVYQIFETPLLNSLLTSLEQDGSTTVVSLGLTVLIMLLPHIPDKLGRMLSRLFNICSRVLCWDKLAIVQKRTAALVDVEQTGKDPLLKHTENDLSTENEKARKVDDGSWRRLEASFDTAYSTPPKASQFFSFLYGLYPLNLLAYLREPTTFRPSIEQEKVSSDQTFDDDLIRSRAQPLIRRHLIHPDLTSMSIETEASDISRWMKLDPSDVVALCISLDSANRVVLKSPTKSQKPHTIADEDVESLDLNSPKAMEGAAVRKKDTSLPSHLPILGSIVHEPRHEGPLTMVDSFISDTTEQGYSSRLASPAFDATRISSREADGLPPTRNPSLRKQVGTDYRDAITIQERLMALEVNSMTADEQEKTKPDSNGPSSNETEQQGPTAYYRRELLLLRNELNYERQLRRQHLHHIGKLQRDLISDTAVEAERQNLYNTTKALKSQVNSLQNTLQSLRNEATTSKLNRARYEASLNDRIKLLREEKKALVATEDGLKTALTEAKEDVSNMRMSLGVAEGNALNLRQQLQVLQPEIQEAKDLQKNFVLLKERIKEAEVQELQLKMEKERVTRAEAKIKSATMAMEAAQGQLTEQLEVEKVLREELNARTGKSLSDRANAPGTNPLLEKMLASRQRKEHEDYQALQGRHETLLKEHRELQNKMLEAVAQIEYKNLSSQHETTRRQIMPETDNRSAHASPSGRTMSVRSKQFSITEPVVTTESAFGERGIDRRSSSLSVPQSFIHGAPRTDKVDTFADPGSVEMGVNKNNRSAPTSSVPTPTPSPTPSKGKAKQSAKNGKKAIGDKAVLGGRFIW